MTHESTYGWAGISLEGFINCAFKTQLGISIHFALDVCCASFFLFHVGIQKCEGNSVLIEISQGAENMQQMLPNSA